MTENGQAAVDALSWALSQGESCVEMVDVFGGFASCTWGFLSPLVGDRGTRAIFERAVHLASQNHPPVRHVSLNDAGLDLSRLRALIDTEEWSDEAVLASLVAVGTSVIIVLTSLTGDLLTHHFLECLNG